MINQAVKSGDYASSSEVIREALREWKAKRLLGHFWDEGMASGDSSAHESMDDIKSFARQQARK